MTVTCPLADCHFEATGGRSTSTRTSRMGEAQASMVVGHQCVKVAPHAAACRCSVSRLNCVNDSVVSVFDLIGPKAHHAA